MNEQQPTQQKRSNAFLARRYHVIGMVGKGGFGAVYKAEDVQRNDALVAIKEINLGGLSSQEMIEATDTFNREVRLLSDLKHPNLPRIYDRFTDAQHWYLAMDFIEGETLEEYLDSTPGKLLPIDAVLDIGMQLCTVLHYLHTRQPPIIFRDVKPANIMRTPSGHLYLIDFGIARHFTPGQARDTMPLGSPGYAAPEQYGRAQTTVQSDIYSLGATLQTLLTGKDPLEPTFGYASPYAEEVPAELELLLVQMLDPDASRRPASMDSVKRALQQVQYEQRLLHSGSLPPRVLPAQRPGYAGQQTPFVGGPGGQVLQSPAKRGISRRTAIIGLVSLVGLVTIGGGLTLSALSQGSQSSQVFQDAHLLYTYRGHSYAVDSVAWSPDGRRIASASEDGTVQVWDALTGEHVLTYRGHFGSPVEDAAWSPNGKYIVSAARGADDTVQVWDAVTGNKILTYRGQTEGVLAVAWSPDSKQIASVSQDVEVWDAATGRKLHTYKNQDCTSQGCSLSQVVAWSPDGKQIAISLTFSLVQVWNALTGELVLSHNGHSGEVSTVAWSPDGQLVASGGGDNTVQVWSAINGSTLYTYRGHSDWVNDLAWSPNGKRIASASGYSPVGTTDNTVQVWDALTGNHAYTYAGHAGPVTGVAWSPDGKRIASGSWDTTVQVWNAP